MTKHFRTPDPEIEENLELMWQCSAFCFLKSFHICKSKRGELTVKRVADLQMQPTCGSFYTKSHLSRHQWRGPQLWTWQCQNLSEFCLKWRFINSNSQMFKTQDTFRYQLWEFFYFCTVYLVLLRFEKNADYKFRIIPDQTSSQLFRKLEHFGWLHICISLNLIIAWFWAQLVFLYACESSWMHRLKGCVMTCFLSASGRAPLEP